MNVVDNQNNQVSVKKKSVAIESLILVNNAMEQDRHSVGNELSVVQLAPSEHVAVSMISSWVQK
jgi:hypothetical protein